MASKPCWEIDVNEAARQLRDALVANATDQVTEIMDIVLSEFPAQAHEELEGKSSAASKFFWSLVFRRCAGEPISRLRGWENFYGLRFQIGVGVLVPRQETELLVEIGVSKIEAYGRALDWGTGCGAIAIALSKKVPSALVDAVDNSSEALFFAKRNAASHGVLGQCTFFLGDWSTPQEKYDLILSNPPYVSEAEIGYLSLETRLFDPRNSWFGGEDGLDAYRSILQTAPEILRIGSWIGLEIGWRQANEIVDLMRRSGFGSIEVYERMSGLARVVFGKLEVP